MASLRSKLFDTYFSFDTRSLALFRIALALTCWFDLWQRFCGGVARQPSSAPHEAVMIVLISGVVFTLLAVGFKTKWAQLLTLVAVGSAAGRLGPLVSPGDAALVSLCVWSVFLPLGERFSVDSVRASLRRREQQAPAELNDRRPIRTPARRFHSLACFVLIVQLVAMALSAATTFGVRDALHRDPLARLPGALADVALVTLAMIAFYPVLVGGHWQRVSQAAASWHERRVVFVDEDCGFCMLCGRLLARLDLLERLEFASNADLDRLPRSISLEQANESITTLEPATGRVQRGAAAFAALLRSLPFGFVAAIPLELPGLSRFAEWAYMRVANNRLELSLWLGYGACGLPGAVGTSADVVDEKSPARLFVDKSLAIAREVCVAVILVVMASDPQTFERWRVSVPRAEDGAQVPTVHRPPL